MIHMTIDLQKILVDGDVRLIGRLAAEHGVTVHLVGGALRNLILGRKLKDLDFTLTGACGELPRSFARIVGGSFFWLDRERLQSRVVKKDGAESLVFDFAPQLGETIAADLCRRDFTINAMALMLGGEGGNLLDPMGGLRDLKNGIVRACSPLVFSDDPLRLLRAIRFAATLAFTIDRSTWQAIVQESSLLARVAGERIRDELFQILAASGIGASLAMLSDSGVLAEIMTMQSPASSTAGRSSLERCIRTAARLETIAAAPDEYFSTEGERFTRILQREVQGGITVLSLLKLAAVRDCASATAARTNLSDRLRLGNSARRMLEVLATKGPAIAALAGQQPTKRDMYRIFRDTEPNGAELVIFSLAGEKAGLTLCATLAEFYCKEYVASCADLHLTGAEVMRLLGIGQGQVVGEVLEHLREAESAGMVNSKAEAEDFIKRNLLTKAEPIG